MADSPSPVVGVPSPCINVCRIDPADGWCDGCLRTVEEIAVWSRLSDDGKRLIWHRLDARREARFGPLPPPPGPAD